MGCSAAAPAVGSAQLQGFLCAVTFFSLGEGWGGEQLCIPMGFAPRFPSGLTAVFLTEHCDSMGTLLWVLSAPNPALLRPRGVQETPTLTVPKLPRCTPLGQTPFSFPFLRALFTRESIPAPAARCVSGRERSSAAKQEVQLHPSWLGVRKEEPHTRKRSHHIPKPRGLCSVLGAVALPWLSSCSERNE